MENKMDWLIKRHNENKHEFLIEKTGRKFGTVVIPTGGGKSGHIYEDIIFHIQEHLKNRKEGDKVIFNLSTPILKLCAQLTNDLFNVLSVLFKDEWKKDMAMFFINSTADGRAFEYVDEMNCNVNRFSTDIDKFFNNDKCMFAFVASCHPSLIKRFASKIDELSEKATIYNYIDEAHQIVCRSDGDDIISYARDDKRRETYKNGNDVMVDEMTEEEKECYDSFEKVCAYSDNVYLFSATPNKEVCQVVRKCSEYVDGHCDNENGFIINIDARELIKKGVILPPNPYIRTVDSSEYEDTDDSITTSLVLTPEVCIEFMSRAKVDAPNIHHKILVNCGSTDHAISLAKGIQRISDYKVFMTTHKTKAKASNGREMEDIDPIKFINDVDNYDGDCFVLHIRQLIQGIDIRSLTGCILYNASKVNDGVKRWIVQTIGRTIRPYNGERPENLAEKGLTFADRKKQYGSVFILIGGEHANEVKKQVGNIFWRYYGLDGYSAFTRPAGKTTVGQRGKSKLNKGEQVEDIEFNSEDDDEIYKLTAFVSDLINDYFNDHADTFRVLNRLGMSEDDIMEQALPEMKRKAANAYKLECGINEPENDIEVEVFKAITDSEWNEQFLENTDDFMKEYGRKKLNEILNENPKYQTAV